MPRLFAVNKHLPMAAEMAIFLLLVLLMTFSLSPKLQAQGPALTTISDTVYRADGTAASGMALISWPSFVSAGGDTVAAGNLTVTIGPLGAFTAQLVPNVGASPAGTYYVVVFQLDDGTVRTEYWAVSTTSPTTIAAVLATPGTGVVDGLATQQYVKTAVATIDATVVHLAGTETITGIKQFASTAFTTIQPHHIITLIDSQPSLTQSTWGYRPPASANDTWIGTDVPSGGAGIGSGQLAFGAPVSITNYIAQTGDGIHANWMETLSASLKEFNVPTKFDQGVTLAGLANGCLNVISGLIASTGAPCGTGGGGGNVSSVFGRSGAVVATSGDYTASQVTGAAVDAAVVHLANTETITGAKTFTGNVAVSGNLSLPQGNGYVPAVGGIGLDTTAGLPVVNIGGTTQRVALTSSNISGQAGTALVLAAVPTQCDGSFATGIAANGNANCTTADVIQLSETTPPAGIPNWGMFWFDSATHTPRVIENNGQVMQLGLTNLFNSDPGGDPNDNLEQRNGNAAQNLRVYSSYTNSAAWTRMSLGSETIGTTNYNVLRSEDATSGNALSLGISQTLTTVTTWVQTLGRQCEAYSRKPHSTCTARVVKISSFSTMPRPVRR